MIGKWECFSIMFICIAVAICAASYNLTRTDVERRVEAYKDCMNFVVNATHELCKEVVGE